LLRVDSWYFSPKLKSAVDVRNSDSGCSGASVRELLSLSRDSVAEARDISGTDRKEVSAVESLKVATGQRILKV
jgi:hypothetical protein